MTRNINIVWNVVTLICFASVQFNRNFCLHYTDRLQYHNVDLNKKLKCQQHFMLCLNLNKLIGRCREVDQYPKGCWFSPQHQRGVFPDYL